MKAKPWLLLWLMCLCACNKPVEQPLNPGIELRPRWHQDAMVQVDGSLKPRWFGPERKIGLCLDVPLTLDTSQWKMGFRFSPLPKRENLFTFRKRKMVYERRIFQAETTLCFGQTPPPNLPSSQNLEVCGSLHDALKNAFYRVPCFRAVYETDVSDFKAQREGSNSLFMRREDMSSKQLIEEFEKYALRLDAKGFPFQAFRLRLGIIEHLRNENTSQALAGLDQRFDGLAPWLDDPAATASKVAALHERARFHLVQGRRRRAWVLLEEASEVARKAAVPLNIAVVEQQAAILARAGGEREAIERLRGVLEGCALWPCHRLLIQPARDFLAWLLVIDPEVSSEGIELAEASLNIAATGKVWEDSRETANRRINMALLGIRQDRDPTPRLDEARAILEEGSTNARTRYLLAWADVVEGLAALEISKPLQALELCQGPATQSSFPVVAAWAWSCLGQAHRQLGDRAAAAAAFDQAMVRHTLATPSLGQDLPLSPGQRVDDYYRAARLAIERQDAAGAWQILETLDHFSIDSTAACEDEDEALRGRLERQRQELLEELAFTDPPFAPERERQLEPVRRSLMESLEELQRTMLSACHRPLKKVSMAADLRAFALPDEIIVLARGKEGKVTVGRRGSLSRLAVRKILNRLGKAQSSEGVDDEIWKELARPLAEALIPADVENLPAVTRVALHGLLQGVPLAALPVQTREGERWLGELTTPVLQPAFVEETAGQPAVTREGAPLFIVDPERNLPSAGRAKEMYRESFPQSKILHGEEATLGAVRSALHGASFLHLDAHGEFESAFPSLSRLQLSDGPMTLADFALAPVPRSLVNLSGCHTGSSTQTGDSGRYGLAGAVARRGVRWVVANRGAIEDRLGHDFNRAFYGEIKAGSEIPAAFHSALREVRQRYPASTWSNLLLLGSGVGGKSDRPRTTSR